MACQTFYAYLAGLIDGDGCIHLKKTRKYKGKQYYALRVSIANASKKTLKDIRNLVNLGGSIYQTHYRGVYGDNERDCYQLDWNSRKAQQVLVEILHFLRIKHSQAIMGILSMELPKDKEAIKLKLQKLKKEI